MNDATIEIMNAKIDVLFGQIAKLRGDKLTKAVNALDLWRSAKVQEQVGLGPMEARAIYRIAYDTLHDGLGLETGGMLKPYEQA